MADAPSPVGAEPEPDLEPEAAEVTLAHLVVQVKRANPQARLKKLVQLIKEAAAPYGLPVNTKAVRELLAQAQAQAQVDMLILEDIGEAALVEDGCQWDRRCHAVGVPPVDDAMAAAAAVAPVGLGAVIRVEAPLGRSEARARVAQVAIKSIILRQGPEFIRNRTNTAEEHTAAFLA